MNLALILSMGAAILWFVALALWLRGDADSSTANQTQRRADDQLA